MADKEGVRPPTDHNRVQNPNAHQGGLESRMEGRRQPSTHGEAEVKPREEDAGPDRGTQSGRKS